MIRLTRATAWLIAAGIPAIGYICSCGPTGPGNNAPSLAPVADRTVFVGEPIDFRISATDPEGDAIAFSLFGAPGGASLDPSSGLFSWRPALSDTGEKTMTFRASDGAHEVSSSAKFTVIMPSLGESEVIRFLRPAGGEVYTYGDTLTIAFVMKWCGYNAYMQVRGPNQSPCSFAGTSMYWPTRDSNDSTDADGRVCKFSRRFQDRGLWIGYYRLPLIDVDGNSNAAGCAIGFGGAAARVDSLYLFLKDPYADTRNPMECASDPPSGIAVINALLSGNCSNKFSVAPRQ
jgi:hypothetical protein